MLTPKGDAATLTSHAKEFAKVITTLGLATTVAPLSMAAIIASPALAQGASSRARQAQQNGCGEAVRRLCRRHDACFRSNNGYQAPAHLFVAALGPFNYTYAKAR
jgi:hypothetical protein